MARLISIASVDDPRIAPYQAIRERDLAAAHGLRFIAEGIVVVKQLLESKRFETESLLLSQAKARSLEPFLQAIPDTLPVHVAPQTILDSIVGFPVHRGVLAVGLRRRQDNAAALLAALPPQSLVLGLVGLANHDNVGGIFRNAAAFGVDAVLLDRASCDPLYRKAIRVSVGAALRIPFAWVEDSAEMLNRLDAAGFTSFALSPNGAETLQEAKCAPRTALLLGAEGPGLPTDILSQTRSLRIPMRDGFDSLNVATAAGIALYALTSSSEE